MPPPAIPSSGPPPLPPLSSPQMSSPEAEAATALKLQGNKAFAQHDWHTAVDFYTKAIEKYDKDPSFFCNRAQVRAAHGGDHPLAPRSTLELSLFTDPALGTCADGFCVLQAHIKLEAYGYAIADATKAIELDPGYVKVRSRHFLDIFKAPTIPPHADMSSFCRRIGDGRSPTLPSSTPAKPSRTSEPLSRGSQTTGRPS